MSDINLKELKKVIPFKWRVQSVSKQKPVATCVAYVDSRDIQNLLDEVLGVENWQSDYKEVKGNLYAGIGIYANNQWIWKWDCGTESASDKEKGEASDAFKRAAVKIGCARWLYEMPIQYLPTNEAKTGNNRPYPIDNNGKRIWDISSVLNANPKVKEFIEKHKLKMDISKEPVPEIKESEPVKQTKKKSEPDKSPDSILNGALSYIAAEEVDSVKKLDYRYNATIKKYPHLKDDKEFNQAYKDVKVLIEAKEAGL